MPFDPKEYPHADLTKRIIGAAMTVHREIGPGLDEKIYENALCLELAHLGIGFSQQEQFPIYYRGHIVGKLITDLIVERSVVVETKVAGQIADVHVAQTLGYLSITGLKVGLILNFKNASLTFKRVANIYLKNNLLNQ